MTRYLVSSNSKSFLKKPLNVIRLVTLCYCAAKIKNANKLFLQRLGTPNSHH